MIRKNIEIKDHQVEGRDFLLANNYAICGDEQGLGKTLEAILVQQDKNYKTLVICPATLKLGWKEEFEKFTDLAETAITVGLKNNHINIINYEHIYKCTELMMQADLIIIDEAQYLIHLESQRTTFAHRMIKKYKPERLVLLTGTPIKNRIQDFYSLMMLVNYNEEKAFRFPTQESWNDYFCHFYLKKVYCNPKNRPSFTTRVKQYTGFKEDKLPELKKLMAGKLIRRLAKNVLDLPELIFKDITVSYKDDKELEKAFKQFKEGEEYDSSVKRKAAVSVAPFTAKYVKDMIQAGEGPVIIFSDYKDPLSIIEETLSKSKITMGRITGDDSLANRDIDRKLFQAGKLDVILCTVGAAAEGITLTASRNMVLNDLPWAWDKMSQLIKRFHRIGQERKCVVHRMIGTKVYKRIITDLFDKEQTITTILGD